jgi:hypothetical protein
MGGRAALAANPIEPRIFRSWRLSHATRSLVIGRTAPGRRGFREHDNIGLFQAGIFMPREQEEFVARVQAIFIPRPSFYKRERQS